MAGMVHFSLFFRYMEEAEHAIWRAAGLSVASAGPPRSAGRASRRRSTIKRPLRFEDEFDVTHSHRRALAQDDSLRVRADEGRRDASATGALTVDLRAHGSRRADEGGRDSPEIAARLRGRAAGGRPMRDEMTGMSARHGHAETEAATPTLERRSRDAERVARSGSVAWRDSRPQRVLHAEARARASTPAALRCPRISRAAADDEGGADRRSGRAPAVGHGADRADRALHALQPDLLDHRAAAAVARHQRELAVDARVLEGRLPRRARRPRRSHLLPVLVRAVPRLLDRVRGGLPDRRALRPGRRHVEPACVWRSSTRVQRDGRLLHADLCAAAGGSGGARQGIRCGAAESACAS